MAEFDADDEIEAREAAAEEAELATLRAKRDALVDAESALKELKRMNEQVAAAAAAGPAAETAPEFLRDASRSWDAMCATDGWNELIDKQQAGYTHDDETDEAGLGDDETGRDAGARANPGMRIDDAAWAAAAAAAAANELDDADADDDAPRGGGRAEPVVVAAAAEPAAAPPRPTAPVETLTETYRRWDQLSLDDDDGDSGGGGGGGSRAIVASGSASSSPVRDSREEQLTKLHGVARDLERIRREREERRRRYAKYMDE